MLLDQVADRSLVAAVRMRVQEADRDRLHAFALELGQCRQHILLVDVVEHIAGSAHALGHLKTMSTRNQRLRASLMQIVQRASMPSLVLENVSKTAGAQHAHAGALAFDDAVGSHGGAVGDLLYGSRVDSHTLEPLEDARETVPVPREH